MLVPERAVDALTFAAGTATTVAGAVLAATDTVGTGLVLGASGVLALMFRYWFSENKRNTDETWNHVDEYRVEREFYRLLADHWQARWLDVVQPPGAPHEIPPMPDLEAMKAEARAEKEQGGRRGRTRK